MTKLTVVTDSAANAQILISFLKNINIVKSVVIEKKKDKTDAVQEPAEEYNWINPSRPATDEEFEKMIAECEAEYKAGLGMPVEEAKALTEKKIVEWRKKNRK